MPGFFGCPAGAVGDSTSASLDSYGICTARRARPAGTGLQFEAAWAENRPLQGDRLFESERWVGLFAGDLLDEDGLPWPELIRGVAAGDDRVLSRLNGVWAMALCDREHRRVHLVSDRRSMHPLYYVKEPDGLYFATQLATFCRWSRPASFDRRWLWDLLFYNYPIGLTTFIEGVETLPPASVATIDLDAGTTDVRQYAKLLRPSHPLLDRHRTLAQALELFADRVPRSFDGAAQPACSLTGGWDTRTVLNYGLDRELTVFSYGDERSDDVRVARTICAAVGRPHRLIEFGEEFERRLPELIHETVFRSSGQQNPARASVLYAFEQLTDLGRAHPLLLEGLSLDTMFRGHAVTPSTASNELAALLGGGDIEPHFAAWRDVLLDPDPFEEYERSQIASLGKRFGKLTAGGAHLGIFAFEADRGYYTGEWSLADNLTTLRAPGWDNALLEFAYSTALSALHFSQFLPDHQRGQWEEVVLQAHLLTHGPRPALGRIPVGGSTPAYLLQGRWLYTLEPQLRRFARVVRRGGRRQRAESGSAEHWDRWFGMLSETVDGLLFRPDSRLRSVLTAAYLDRVRRERRRHDLKKLMQIEIVMRLVENGWQRFWQH